jgi:UDP-N-acetyl-D-mannosaminuronic acid dehydrogenase
MYKTVCVVGLGYIGLPTALLMAQAGLTVFGFDVDEQKIEKLRKGELPFKEVGLAKLFKEVRKTKRFLPVNEIPIADAYLIAVPTPYKNKAADLKYVKKALQMIKSAFPTKGTIVIESTIGPRDCDETLIPLINEWNKPYIFAHCPERAIPGSTLHEMVHNDRIVGGRTREEAKQVVKLYQTFVRGKVFATTATVAASVKVMENTYRATNIALANEFAQIASTIGFDVWEAIDLANKHPRVSIHQPGPGVGGHCIPIDPWFFVQDSPKGIVEASLKKNESMPAYVTTEILNIIKANKINKPIVGILGYAYKKNVDDSRETPAKALFELMSEHCQVYIADPFCHKSMEAQSLPVLPTEQLLAKVNIIILATDHDQFKKIHFNQHPHIRVVYDTRNMFSSAQFADSKTEWHTLGRAS